MLVESISVIKKRRHTCDYVDMNAQKMFTGLHTTHQTGFPLWGMGILGEESFYILYTFLFAFPKQACTFYSK